MNALETYLAHVQRFGIRPGLERIAVLLQRAANPQKQYPIVLVGGTNGKGSTCEFLARQLAASHRRIGLYTSPHLYHWNERIRVITNAPHETPNANLFRGAIGATELDQLFADARPHLDAVTRELGQPTEFETLTFLGLWHFARAGVDAAVVEVGLGGRWDATNIVEPQVSIVTHVALDHCDRLGDTLEEIAGDKVCIARRERVLITNDTKPEVLRVFTSHARREGARLWPLRAPEESNDRAALDECLREIGTFPDESADFQQTNWHVASVARFAFERALDWPHATPAQDGHPTLQRTLRAEDSSSLVVPGRAEILRRNPTIILDGANNPDGATILARVLQAELRATQSTLASAAPAQAGHPTLGAEKARRLILVAGILADKDFAQMLSHLAPLAEIVIATQSPSPRAASAAQIAEAARGFCARVEIVTPVMAALRRALEIAAPDDVICVCGSFYTVAEVERDVVLNWRAGV